MRLIKKKECHLCKAEHLDILRDWKSRRAKESGALLVFRESKYWCVPCWNNRVFKGKVPERKTRTLSGKYEMRFSKSI